jgi:hypothetical protein
MLPTTYLRDEDITRSVVGLAWIRHIMGRTMKEEESEKHGGFDYNL